MGDYTRQINYKGKDHIAATYYAKKEGEVVTSTLWNAVLGALVIRSNAYDTALQQTAAFESNFLLFQQEYRKFTQDFEAFKLSRAEFESNTISRFSGLESAIDGLRVGQSSLEADDVAIRAALTVFDTDINTLKSDVAQRMTRSEVHDYVADELSKDEYVKNTDYATNNKAGVMKIGTGLVQMSDGVVQLYPACENDINGKTVIKAITPQFLDYAVKTSVTTNTETLTEEEKAAACEWIGALPVDIKEGELIGHNHLYARGADGDLAVVPYGWYAGANVIAIRGANGTLIVGTPIEDAHAATKAYVDNAVAEPKYELIDTITTTEEVNAITCTTEPNGTPYNFKKVRMFVTMPNAISQTSDFVHNVNNKFWQIGFVPAGNATAVGEYIAENGFVTLETHSSHNQYTQSNTWATPVLCDTITNVKFENGQSGVLPIGTKIEIWGVRA